MDRDRSAEVNVYYVPRNRNQQIEEEGVYANMGSCEDVYSDTANENQAQPESPPTNSEKGLPKFIFSDVIWKVTAVIGLLVALICIGLVIAVMQRDTADDLNGNFGAVSDNDKKTTTGVTTALPTASTNNEETSSSTTVETTTIYDGGTWFEPAKSCQELRIRGIVNDGIYVIKPSADSSAYQVFCDLTTSGGGWTLVASVHENNINGKCTVGDKWSSEQGWTSSVQEGKGGENWINLNTFGHIESATSADFKSLAYHNMKASNVMLWHVGNDVPIHRASEESFLKYYTNDSILMQYGGSLRDLFKNLTVTKSNTEDLVYPRTTTGLSRISRLQNYVPNWYNYSYDQGRSASFIGDGGGDMYDGGNRVYYRAGNGLFKQVTYGESVRYYIDGYIISSYATHPFVFLMWIDSTTSQGFSIKITSNAGADGGGDFSQYSSSTTYGTSTLHFHSFQVYGTSDPTICGVLFYVDDRARWNSKSPTTFVRDEWTTGTDSMTHSVIATGNPTNIMMGYVLLSRTSGKQVYTSSISNAMYYMLQDIYSADISKYKVHGYDRVASPVHFAKGNLTVLQSTLPPSLTSDMYQTGFLQFGAETNGYDLLSLCPGVRIKVSSAAEHMCIGSLRISSSSSYCGDYAGWAGRTGDVVLPDRPSGYAHSCNDISSTILIFTR